MEISFIEPADGDVVVVRASHAPDGQPRAAVDERYAVITWGAFELVSDRMASLSKREALLEARHCASERARSAWNAAGAHMVRLPRLPLVYRDGPQSFTVSVDATDYARGESTVSWKNAAHLSEAQALDVLVADGLSMDVAKALTGKAPMPEACA